jgi:glycosyltransferase involved in cell wall biosynthesis
VKIYINGRYLTQEITGVQRYSHELIRTLDAECAFEPDADIALLTPSRGLRFQPEFQRIRVRKVGERVGHMWEQMDLPRHSADGVLFCPGNTAPVLSLVQRRPTVVTLHDLSYKYFPDAYRPSFRLFYGLLVPLILRLARGILTVSNSEAAAIVQHYPCAAGKLLAVQNGGFGPEVLERITRTPSREIGFSYGLYVGSLSRRKNFPALLQAAIRFARETGFGFVFIGSVPAALRSSAVEIPPELRGRILFPGQVNDALELVGWYKGALFLAFPSLYEASPFPPIEAMSCGCPVVAARIPSLVERCGQAALYCDPTDICDIADAMIRLCRDERLRAELAARGSLRMREFSWSQCAVSTFRVLRAAALAECGR